MTGAPPHSGLQQVYFQSRPLLTRLVRARGLTPDEAEEVLQELYLKLENTISAPIADPVAYLCRMASNLVIDQRRAAQRRAQRHEDWSSTHYAIDRERDETPSAEAQLIARERLDRVEAALAALPARTVQVFKQFRLEGMPQREIAQVQGISLSAVEKHLQRAYRVILAVQTALDADLLQPERHIHERALNVDQHN